jgi:hypothetical protein
LQVSHAAFDAALLNDKKIGRSLNCPKVHACALLEIIWVQQKMRAHSVTAPLAAY